MTTLTSVRHNPIVLIVETMRPRQWIKNAFVLAGVVFGAQLGDATAVANALLATAAFCVASGAAYLLNDAMDAATDRLNPRTATRPIARGDLGVRTAQVAAVVAMVAAIAIGLAINVRTTGVIAAFLVLQIAYSLRLKHVLFVDVMLIAILFVLRALAGIEAVEVRVSPWLLLCTGMLALFLALAKRRAEVVALGGASHPQRPVLDYYSVGLLDELISVVTPSMVMVYALYTVLGASTDTMLVTLPFVIYGVFRVLFLMHHDDATHNTEEIDTLVYRDRALLACVALWGITSAVIIATA